MINIIAHRGANKKAPQNTIPAFLKAIELGANGMENDVHLTKDGVLVICHDYEIDQTSNATGLISDYTLEELRKLDFGSYFSEEYKGTQIPTLDEFLDIAQPLAVINIEIKSPKQKGTDIVRKTIQAVKEHHLFDRLIISSFDDELLIEAKEIDTSVKTGLLYSPQVPKIAEIFEDYIGFVKRVGADYVHPLCFYVDEAYIENCHKNHIGVNPWTVNLPDGMKALNEWGCDGLITDVPDVAYEMLRV